MSLPESSHPEPSISDHDLVVRAQSGDSEAFDALVIRYQKPLYSVIYNIVFNDADTKDILMETLIKAYKNISRFRLDSKFYTWIYQIAYNESINVTRRRKRSIKIQEVVDAEGEGGSLDGAEFQDLHPSGDSSRQLELKELENKLNESLASLSEEHRTVVNLFDIQGLSHAEIAEIMKCSEGTVRSRLHYAHKQLQKLLRHYIN